MNRKTEYLVAGLVGLFMGVILLVASMAVGVQTGELQEKVNTVCGTYLGDFWARQDCQDARAGMAQIQLLDQLMNLLAYAALLAGLISMVVGIVLQEQPKQPPWQQPPWPY